MASNVKLNKKLPLLLIDGVLFPGASMRIPVSSEKNMNMVKTYLLPRSTESNAIIGVVPRARDKTDEDAEENAFHNIGTAGIVIQVTGVNWPKPAFAILVSGLCRFKLDEVLKESPYFEANVSQLDMLPNSETDFDNASPEFSDLLERFREQANRLIDVLDLSVSAATRLKRFMNSLPVQNLPDLCASVVRATHNERLEMLDAVDLADRFRKTLPFLTRQIETLEILKISKKYMGSSEKFKLPMLSRKPFSLFDDNEKTDEISVLEKKVKGTKMPSYAKNIALREVNRLKRLPSYMPDHSVTRNYIELITELPWCKESPEITDIKRSREFLDADHYGMEKLKKRVLEYLAVRQLKNSVKGPILCFVGPPGVGKTSMGRSIAHSLGREFHRMSLGGICDQADIRGHRRTYIASMPGRIIQGLRRVGVKNPVFLLDEVDKMGVGVHGDPSAALLEVLDPEQNYSFTDHFLNVPFDLSQVLFIATANKVNTIPPALLDRMEIITVPGYTHEEKEHIAVSHLVPKQLAEHGLSSSMVKLTDEAIQTIVYKYTREFGVRGLERKLGAICRAVAVRIVEKHGAGMPVEALDVYDSQNEKPEALPEEHFLTAKSELLEASELPFLLDEEAVIDILGPPIYDNEVTARLSQPGVAIGLGWTATGGQIMFVEATKVDGDGQLILTGQLGKVMKESAKLALNWVRTHAEEYGILVQKGTDLMEGTDVHIHFPSGAVEKDGPSAGITIVTVLISLFTERLVRSDVAMTGEITLRGLVLPVGGIKEKILAAHRAGLTNCLLPNRNAKDLSDIPRSAQNALTFHLCNHVDDALQVAFEGGFPRSRKSEAHVKSKL